MLKIDTQGFEKNVLEEANVFLDKVFILQLEMSIVSLYRQETLFHEMLDYLKERNFELIELENGFYDPETFHLLQVDGCFLTKELLRI